MAKLSTRTPRFPYDPDHRKLKGFHAPQRKRKVLKPGAKPQHGVSQPMPSAR